MKSKILRYSFGFLVFSLILASILISKIALFCMSIIFIIFTIKEYRQMFMAKDVHIFNFIPELISIVLSYLFIFDRHEWVTPTLVIGIFLTFMATVIKNKKPYLLVSFSTIMGFIFTFCALYIVKLFYVYPEDNIRVILVYVAAVMMGDFSASKIGPRFKNKLLSPEISPNKTVAGSISNVIFTCLTCCLLYPIFKIWQCIILGVAISLFAQIGDLTISLIKRDLGIKHSSNLFLNYGGILDRVDAFIFSAPIAYYFILFILMFLR